MTSGMTMLNDYHQVVQYLYQALPMYQRIGASAIKKDLANTLALCRALGNPEQKFKSIHVAGTNGKGSVSHMLAAILQSAGYTTGLYTSPHLKSFTERIRVNGKEAEQEYIIQFVRTHQALIEEIKPSFFEITVAMAFDYFARCHVDVAVVEVGLGGRLDSTNVITPVLSVITNIGMDHKDLLGDTLEKIAGEKAGIIKPGVPVVVSERQPDVEQVFTRKASDTVSSLCFGSDRYQVSDDHYGNISVTDHDGRTHNWSLALKGYYQRKNLPGVLAAVDKLRNAGFIITDDHIANGLANVITLTGLKGRWQQIGESPRIICDTGHNVEGITEVLAQIKTLSFRHLHIVIGLVKDKDVNAVLSMFPREASYYFCQANIPRALEAERLATAAEAFGLTGVVEPDVNRAIALAKQQALPDDFIFVGGSSFVVAEIDNL